MFSIRCDCHFHCPDDHLNFTCLSDHKCFTIRKVIEGTKDTRLEYGCINQRGAEFQCARSNSFVPNRIMCCDDYDLCNEDLIPVIEPEVINRYYENLNISKKEPVNNSHSIALTISVTICVVFLVIALSYFYLRYRQITSKRERDSERKLFITDGSTPVSSYGELCMSSDTGSGLPALTKRSIACEISFYEEIGRGQFSVVYKGRWKQQYVAVKSICEEDQLSWNRELEIHKTAYLRHENILCYIGSDTQENDTTQEVRRLIITAYHPYKSLYDFLQTHSFDYRILYRLAYSAVCGLHYIHRSISGVQGKPPIAHRNVKSKNILVKENLTCCIGDLGLAINIDPETREINFNSCQKLPAIRYMAPEILEDTEILHSFDTYQKSDIFSFGLVLWELTRRYELAGVPLDYQPPYFEYVGTNPTLEDMRNIAVHKQIKPTLPPRFGDDFHGKVMKRLIQECLHYSPSARLTAARVKKTLHKCVIDQNFEDSGGSNTCNTTSTGLSL